MAGLPQHWYRLTPVSMMLLPLAALYCVVTGVRRLLYRVGLLRTIRLTVPVIVVGNITVGGTGKTPLVLWLVEELKRAGYRPGIVTRGYRGRSRVWPLGVTPSTSPDEAGDEAVLLAARGQCPVQAGPDRVAGGKRLIDLGCDVLVSDDGLQHYRLHRDMEIAVLDGARRTGNGLCLPAGPLREPVSRLRTVTAQVINGSPRAGELGMSLMPAYVYRLDQPAERFEPDRLRGAAVHAVAGIGNPERFFSAVRALGMDITPHPFPDHHAFRAADLDFGNDHPIIMTEKDAVKCRPIASNPCWVLAVTAQPDPALRTMILKRLGDMKRG